MEIKVTNPEFRCGHMMLTPSNVVVLGGGVVSLRRMEKKKNCEKIVEPEEKSRNSSTFSNRISNTSIGVGSIVRGTNSSVGIIHSSVGLTNEEDMLKDEGSKAKKTVFPYSLAMNPPRRAGVSAENNNGKFIEEMTKVSTVETKEDQDGLEKKEKERKMVGSGKKEIEMWICGVCTFRNDLESKFCKVCEYGKEVSCQDGERNNERMD